MLRTTAILLAAVIAALLPTRAAHAQNAENGQKAFRQICSICHEAVAGRNRVGPRCSAWLAARPEPSPTSIIRAR